MSQGITKASAWLYGGVWGVLVRWFRVPQEPPTLPALTGETVRSFRPSLRFLDYLKFQFWLTVILIDLGLFIGLMLLLYGATTAGMLLTPFALAAMTLPAVLAYVALHLRFDTTWYVVSDRSLRIRRGIWVIRETTITFENIQNVAVEQGPLQRWFGISDVQVQTAGGGGSAAQGHESAAMMGGHNGLIEGIDNAHEIRDLILSRLKRSNSAGLGDDQIRSKSSAGFSAEHIAVLREIRKALAG